MNERASAILGTDQREGVDATQSDAEAFYGFKTLDDGTRVFLQPALIFALETTLVIGDGATGPGCG